MPLNSRVVLTHAAPFLAKIPDIGEEDVGKWRTMGYGVGLSALQAVMLSGSDNVLERLMTGNRIEAEPFSFSRHSPLPYLQSDTGIRLIHHGQHILDQQQPSQRHPMPPLLCVVLYHIACQRPPQARGP